MPEQLPPELIEQRDQVEALAYRVLVPLRDRAAAGEDVAVEVREASKAAGIFPMTQPVEQGGTEASALALTVVRDTLAGHDVVHLPGIFGPDPGLLAGVDEPLRSQFLVPLLAGEKRGGFGFTEPADAERHTFAVEAGDELIVTGRKSYVTGGAEADFINALVEIEGSGPAMVLIETSAPGVTMERRFDSLDGSHHAALAFAEVRVPAAHVIGQPGRGTARAIGQINQVRLSIAAACVGLGRYVVGLVEDRLRSPGRDGELGGASERARLAYGDMRLRTYVARSALYRTARLVDAGANPINGNPINSNPINPINEVAAIKVFATETIGAVVDAAIQLIGGEALVEGQPLESILRRVRVLRLAEGESDLLRTNIARGRLDLDAGRL